MDSKETFSAQGRFLGGLSARRKLGLIVLLILVSAVLIDPFPKGPSNSDTASDAESNQFAAMDELLASFEQDDVAAPNVEPDAQPGDTVDYLFIKSCQVTEGSEVEL